MIDLIFTDGLKSGKVDRLSYRWVDMSTGSQVNRSTVDTSTGRRVEHRRIYRSTGKKVDRLRGRLVDRSDIQVHG